MKFLVKSRKTLFNLKCKYNKVTRMMSIKIKRETFYFQLLLLSGEGAYVYLINTTDSSQKIVPINF